MFKLIKTSFYMNQNYLDDQDSENQKVYRELSSPICNLSKPPSTFSIGSIFERLIPKKSNDDTTQSKNSYSIIRDQPQKNNNEQNIMYKSNNSNTNTLRSESVSIHMDDFSMNPNGSSSNRANIDVDFMNTDRNSQCKDLLSDFIGGLRKDEQFQRIEKVAYYIRLASVFSFLCSLLLFASSFLIECRLYHKIWPIFLSSFLISIFDIVLLFYTGYFYIKNVIRKYRTLTIFLEIFTLVLSGLPLLHYLLMKNEILTCK